jgi:cytochrome P450
LGRTFSKGTLFANFILPVHWSEKYWTNAENFIPERFLDGKDSRAHSFAYIPFSAGPRNCLGTVNLEVDLTLSGSKFAIQEAVIIFSMMLQHFSVIHHDSKNFYMAIMPTCVPEGLYVKFLPRV